MYSPSPDGMVTARVETAIRKTLGTDSCNRESVARTMAMHPRTLQRRLKRENTSFEDIRERIRPETVEYYMRHTNMPLYQVGGLVGYAEQAVLSRSCRCWFGQSPRRIRTAAQEQRSESLLFAEIMTLIVFRDQNIVSKNHESPAEPE